MWKRIKMFLVSIYNFLFYYDIWEEREKKRCFGMLNPDKTFYVIRFDKDRFGLMTIWKFVLAHIDYARKMDYIPIVDLKNYYSLMIQNVDSIGKQNAWEYYFEQPDTGGYTLEEIYKSKNVILALKNVKLSEDVRLVEFPMNDKEFQYWYDVSRYIPVKKEVELAALKLKEELFPKGKKILGVSIRFEYSFLQEIHHKVVNNHPIQPEIEEIINDVKKCMDMWECDYCFLAVDDEEKLNILKENLREKCIYMTRWRRNYWKDKRLGIDERSYYYDEPFRYAVSDRGIAYLTELLLLAQCDCLLAGKSSGNVFAYLKNEKKYEHVSIYEKGMIYV